MQILVYDGSFEGFLTCIYKVICQKLNNVQITSDKEIQTSFDTEVHFIKRDINESSKMMSIIKNSQDLINIKYAHSSCNENKNLIILNYIRLVLEFGKNAKFLLNNKEAIAFFDICRKVQYECHILKGFLRFSETITKIYYAKIEPANDIVQFLMPHFINRYRYQKFVIHDIKRNIVGIYDTKKSLVFKNNAKLFIALTEKEENIQKLFKTYYNTINIRIRKNKKQMLNFMPKRYHKHLIELTIL